MSTENHGSERYQECLLQEVIDEQPNVLPVRDFFPGVTGLFSLGREIRVDMGGSDGFVDNMLVANDGHLVIVETKLWRNPQAIREVIAQTLQYCMAVSQLELPDLEGRLRRSDPRGHHLGPDETVVQYVQNAAAFDPRIEVPDDFEDAFDRMRRAGEILLLIVTDCVHPSVERLVRWMNHTVGSSPYTLGLIELCLYDVPAVGRIVVPKTLLRIREGSRHVVTVNLQSAARDQVTVKVSEPDEQTKPRPISPPSPPITEEALTEKIRTKNSLEDAEVAEQLRARLRSSGLGMKATPSEILYGVVVAGDFISLVHLCVRNIYFLIPKRAAVALGDEQFVDCKRKINKIADFYRPFDVDDPSKNNILAPNYSVLNSKVDAFVDAVTEIAEMIRDAMAETL